MKLMQLIDKMVGRGVWKYFATPSLLQPVKAPREFHAKVPKATLGTIIFDCQRKVTPERLGYISSCHIRDRNRHRNIICNLCIDSSYNLLGIFLEPKN